MRLKMKQIRFKDRVYEIEACWDCPLFNDDYGTCPMGVKMIHPIKEGVFPKKCPLEEYEGIDYTNIGSME